MSDKKQDSPGAVEMVDIPYEWAPPVPLSYDPEPPAGGEDEFGPSEAPGGKQPDVSDDPMEVPMAEWEPTPIFDAADYLDRDVPVYVEEE